MPQRATKASWQTFELPEAREPLGYEQVFDHVEADRLHDGLIPKQMEDKWFVYFEDNWLYLHRSWTGILIYWLRLDNCPDGVRVVESWVNRDTEQYRETDLSTDRAMVNFLLRALILEQNVPFPIRENQRASGASLLQHHHVGRQFPIKTDTGQ